MNRQMTKQQILNKVIVLILLPMLLLAPVFVGAQAAGGGSGEASDAAGPGTSAGNTRSQPANNLVGDVRGVGELVTDSGVFESTNLIDTISIVIRWALGFIGIIVFVIFLFAGFEYATAGGDEAKASGAQKRMVNAVIGLIIIFFAFVASNAVLSFVFGTGNA